jgi:hypothetical protein
MQAGTVDVAAFDKAWQSALTSAHVIIPDAHVIIPDAASVISSSGSCSGSYTNGICAAVTERDVSHPGSTVENTTRHRGGRDRLLKHHSRDTGEHISIRYHS